MLKTSIITLTLLISSVVQAQTVDFKRDIQPILENRCWDCHSADAQEGDLRLDQRLGMLRGGGSGIAAIVPGKPDQSYLLDVISHRVLI